MLIRLIVSVVMAVMLLGGALLVYDKLKECCKNIRQRIAKVRNNNIG